MELKNLKLTNFQGIKELTIDFDCQDMAIRGVNGSGKTTIANAISWLLFDKSYNDTPNFNPKPKDEDGNEKHNITVTVEAVIHTSRDITVKKELTENWKKKRGAVTAEYTGNTVDYYIDDIPTTKKEYEARMSDICQRDKARLLMQTNYFSEVMPWEQRRMYLEQVCGTVTDDEVIATDSEFEKFKDFLMSHSPDENRKMLNANRKKLNDLLDELPARIDEVSREMGEKGKYTSAEIYEEIQAQKEHLANIQRLMDSTESVSDAERENNKLINLMSNKIEVCKAEYIKKRAEENNKRKDVIVELNQERDTVWDDAEKHKSYVREKTGMLTRMIDLRKQLSREYEEIKKAEYSGELVCPTCGRAYPESMIDTAQEEFNLHKSEKLEAIKKEIEEKCSKVIIANTERDIEEAESQITQLNEELNELQQKITKEMELLNSIEQYEMTDEYKSIKEKLEELKAKTFEPSDVKKGLLEKTREGEELISSLYEQHYLAEMAEKREARIKELQEEEKKAGNELAEIDNKLYILESFLKKKIEMIDSKVNDKFKTVKFKLGEYQINGGYKMCCEPMIVINDNLIVPWRDANNASKINAGLELIEAFAEYEGTEMPVIVDNAESVIKLKKIKPQVIALYVDKNAETLTFERG